MSGACATVPDSGYIGRIALSAVEAQLVRLAVGRREAAIRTAHAQFTADVAVVLAEHGVTDGNFVGADDGSVSLEVPA